MRISNELEQLYCTRGQHWVTPEGFSIGARARAVAAVGVDSAQQKANELCQLAGRKKSPLF